jgi:hypothetical protein
MIIFSDDDTLLHRRAEQTCNHQTCKRSLQIKESSCGFGFVGNEHNEKAFLRINRNFKTLLAKPMNDTSSASSHLSRRAPGCSSSKQYLFMGAAADCNYVSAYGGPSGALTQILMDFNMASKVYESSFNVALALTKVQLQQSCNTPDIPWNQECSSSYTINKRLR